MRLVLIGNLAYARRCYIYAEHFGFKESPFSITPRSVFLLEELKGTGSACPL